MIIYNFHINTLKSEQVNTFKKTIRLIQKFWKFSNAYGNFIATPLKHRNKTE
ncbi:MAG: hypothetical protein SWJ54_22710 [Cyanobacteriota bacterium]|nr:hypothetical protein [Cyanobacteriota bacterium]